MKEYEFESLKRQMAKDIMRYLRLHPEIMEVNQNQEVYNYVREMRIRQAMKSNTSYENAAFVVDAMCEHEVCNLSAIYRFDQKTLDCFRPNAEQDEKYFQKLLICMMNYKAQKQKTT